MKSTLIAARHAFTTRYGGVSEGDFASLNLGSNRGDEQANVEENFRRVAALMGAGGNDCVVTRQVHGNEVRVASSADRYVLGTRTPYDADGLVTAERGLPIMCFVADCVPALLCDARHGVIAAVHCGWRSSVADILGVTVEKMCALGAEKDNICIAMGAAIGALLLRNGRRCARRDRRIPRRRHGGALRPAGGREVSCRPARGERPAAHAAASGGEYRRVGGVHNVQP